MFKKEGNDTLKRYKRGKENLKGGRQRDKEKETDVKTKR